MNREQIIQMARDAGFGNLVGMPHIEAMERFAILVRAATKEEDAKICEAKADKLHPEGKRTNQVDRHVADVLDRTANEIRASK